jgi:CheY-like chemotaxis protein
VDAPLVLVVDDDPNVREFAELMVADLGFAVLTAASGPEALQVLAERPAVRVLFTDIVMPEMNGFELAARAKEQQPELQVLYATGYCCESGTGCCVPGMVTKPYRAADIAGELTRLMTLPADPAVSHGTSTLRRDPR